MLCYLEYCTEDALLKHHGQTYKVSGISETSGSNYDYTVILGESITQVSTGGGRSWSIGTYARIVGGTEFYVNGDACGSNIKREAKITFFAGRETKMLEASEPSMCKYEFSMQINCNNGNNMVQKRMVHC